MIGGEVANCKAYDALIAPQKRMLDVLLAYNGCDADIIRADLAKRQIGAVILIDRDQA